MASGSGVWAEAVKTDADKQKTANAVFRSNDMVALRCWFSVIASEAKQSIARHNGLMDCFVALLPCANASRLSQAMTGRELRRRLTPAPSRWSGFPRPCRG